MELGRVHLGDCLTLLGKLEAGSVDLVFCDPPYGVTANAWDTQIDLVKMWPLLWRACSETAAVVFTAVQPFASYVVWSEWKHFRYEMIWRKNAATGFLNAKKRPLRIHENVLVFWRHAPPYFPQKTTGHPRFRAGIARNGRSQSKFSKNYGDFLKTTPYDSTERYPTTVLEIAGVEQHDKTRRHPTQKPEELPGWFIKSFTRPCALVLDPCAGSGSTLCAALSLGRRCVGFDNDPESVRKANEVLESRFPSAATEKA